MPTREEIVITFDAEGGVKVEGVGFRGKTCAAATRPFEEALGLQSGERITKPEWYQMSIKSPVKIGGGS